jgi:hypothetical protein
VPFRPTEAFRDTVVRMIRLNSSEAFAEMVARSGAIIATLGEPEFDGQGDIEVCKMNDHSIDREMAISELLRLDDEEEASMSFALETGLGHLLGLSSRKVVTDPEWTPLHDFERQRLLAAVFCGLGGAITYMSDRITVDQLQDGMLAAATIVNDLHTGNLDNDRHRDAFSRVRILIHRARILQHEEMIEERRRERERVTVAALVPAEEASIFG